jgi:aquaporin NIP
MIHQQNYSGRQLGGMAEVRTDKVLQQQPIKIAHQPIYMRFFLLLADCLDETLGTLYLVFFVAGSQVIDQYSTNIGLGSLEITAVTKGFISGLALIGIIIAFGRKSGGHFNPVVTLACVLRGHCSIIRAVLYWAFQFGGGCAGAAILKAIFGNIAFLGTTIPTGTNGKSVGMEVMLTFIFITVILAVSEREESAKELEVKGTNIVLRVSEENRSLMAACVIGFIFGAVQSFGWNISGSSVNPYRSLCPALVNGSSTALKPIWVYFVGPICGSIIAVLYRWLGTLIDWVLSRTKKEVLVNELEHRHTWFKWGKNPNHSDMPDVSQMPSLP